MGRGRGRGGGGAHNKSRTMRSDFKQKRDDTWTEHRDERANHDTVGERRNADFEAYYREQGICPEEEWEALIATLQTPLPITFRINGSSQASKDILRRLEADFFSHFVDDGGRMQLDGEDCEPPRPMLWYPNKMAWHMNFSRAQLRKLPMLTQLHEYIKRETEIGSITRQEAVSMVPPLFLDVQPHHVVLDTCAAPGSKTFQLLEMLHGGGEEASGLVIANDADVQRCNMLAHQTKRMCSPCLVVTNHEAQSFPCVRPSSKIRRQAHGQMLFDRILCDVPCSGDGTIRKSPDIWRRWTVNNGLGLHALQLRITLQACRLLKVGGRLVYSTCTFNPIEDEAVVAAVLRQAQGSMRLVDVDGTMPHLKRRPGMRSWKVMDGNRGWVESWDKVQQDRTKLLASMFPQPQDDFPLERTMRFLPHYQDTGGFYVAVLEKVAECPAYLFPQSSRTEKREHSQGKQASARPEVPADEPAAATDAAATGDAAAGDAAAPAQAEEPEAAPSAAAPAAEEARAEGDCAEARPDGGEGADDQTALRWAVRGRVGRALEGEFSGPVRAKWKGIDPVVPVTDAEVLQPIVDLFGLKPSFPLLTHTITRGLEAQGNPKRLYYVADSVKHLLMMDDSEALKITYTGLKMWERQPVKDGSNPCVYRIAQEGLPFLLPHITKQVLRLPTHEFLQLLEKRTMRFPKSVPYATIRPPQSEAPKPAAPAEGGAEVKEVDSQLELLTDERTLEQLGTVCAGGAVVLLLEEDAKALDLPSEAPSGGCLTSEAPLALSCWRTRATIGVLVAKGDCEQMAEKIRTAQARAKAAASAGGAGTSAEGGVDAEGEHVAKRAKVV